MKKEVIWTPLMVEDGLGAIGAVYGIGRTITEDLDSICGHLDWMDEYHFLVPAGDGEVFRGNCPREQEGNFPAISCRSRPGVSVSGEYPLGRVKPIASRIAIDSNFPSANLRFYGDLRHLQ